MVDRSFRGRAAFFNVGVAAQVWGRLRVPNPDHELDKQSAATALVNDLTVVTRHAADFAVALLLSGVAGYAALTHPTG